LQLYQAMNTTGRLFRVSIFGESHGVHVGVLVDGCPAGILLTAADFMPDLERRKSGQPGTTPRTEDDLPLIESGLQDGTTTGAPILIRFLNKNTQSKEYELLTAHPRPGHADFAAHVKFGGYAATAGGGMFSGRLTLGLVAAGVLAKKIIQPVSIHAQLTEAGGSTDIEAAVRQAVEARDSIGGIVECRAAGLPAGLGEPFFDSVESLISHLAFSIPAVKGIEFGSGFAAAMMRGSEHNDPILNAGGTTASNNAGGINGGITNGNELVFRVAVKPTSSIGKPQISFHLGEQKSKTMEIHGRHDACIALRVPVVLESITAIALADCMLIAQQRKPIF